MSIYMFLRRFSIQSFSTLSACLKRQLINCCGVTNNLICTVHNFVIQCVNILVHSCFKSLSPPFCWNKIIRVMLPIYEFFEFTELNFLNDRSNNQKWFCSILNIALPTSCTHDILLLPNDSNKDLKKETDKSE